jgi:hypothetical protein
MPTIEELKARVDLHDLAEKLGLERPGSRGNYKSPHHADKAPSLSIHDHGRKWKDWSTEEGGSCIDLVMYVEGLEVGAAVKRIHELYGWEMERPRQPELAAPAREKTRAEFIAEKCYPDALRAADYLHRRGILESVVERAIARRTVGFNAWTSTKIPEGEPGHGGPAVAFICVTSNPGHVVAVDMRYVDPVKNGNVKTTCQGEKSGHAWVSDWKSIERARTVYIVESPINALSIESCQMTATAALAIRGTANTDLDFRILRGKQVIVCCDHTDPVNEKTQLRPGLAAAWKLHETLTALDISCLLVDQSAWDEGEDVNDVLKKHDAGELTRRLKQLEQNLIAGMAGKLDAPGKPRIYLPSHDFAAYWKYKVKADFTSFVTKVEADSAGGDDKLSLGDLAGFRVAAVSRVSIASAVATMTGEADSQPKTLFAVSVQVPRHGPNLQRRVLEDDDLHNAEQWKKFGPIYNQAAFLRMVNILERGAHLGARHAANFVGLAWREQQLVVNEGPDCYFGNPEQQCPYHNLIFPSGSRQDARSVLREYQHTFDRNAALLALVWALGGHLKVLLGFWPHLMMQADKGAGKSTLIKRLERTLAMTMFSGQSLQTEFRLLTSISHTSHPVGWEEISARRQDIIDKAVALLQEAYQYTLNRRGSDMTEFLIAAPVLLAGEDVPVRSLIGKLVRTELTGKKGDMLREDLPRFPVRQWLEFLASFSRQSIADHFHRIREHLQKQARASSEDSGAARMVTNYAAIGTAWRLLCEFADMDPQQGDFPRDLIAEMNAHIRDTVGDREPWVWIIEKLVSEIAMGEFRFPHSWDTVEDKPVLQVRPGHIVDHLSRTPALRQVWDALPVKSDRVLKKQLLNAGALITNADGTIREFEVKFRSSPGDPGFRAAHMVGIDLHRLAEFGVYATPHASLPKEVAGHSDAP